MSKGLEIVGKAIGWTYLTISSILIIAASIIYIVLIFQAPIDGELFPGFYIILSVTLIILSIPLIYVSYELIDGIKNKTPSKINFFRRFLLICVAMSFIITALSIFEIKFDIFHNFPVAIFGFLSFLFHVILLIIIDSIIEKIKKDQRKCLNINGPIYTIPTERNDDGHELSKKDQFMKQQFREMSEYFGDKF